MPPVEGVDPKHKATARARSTPREPQDRRTDRAVLRPGLQDRRRQARRPALRPRLLRRRSKANSRVLNPGKDKKENVAQLWHIQADQAGRAARSGQRRRHRRRHRPARLGHRRHALRHAATRSCWSRSSSPRRSSRWRSSPRASADRKKLADTLEMLETQDPTFARQRERGDRPDAHQRHGRAAPGGDQAPPAARLQPEREGPQAARQLPRDDRPRGRGRRRVPPPHQRRARTRPSCGSASSRCRTAAGVVVSTVPNDGPAGRHARRSCSKNSKTPGQGGGVLGFPLMRIKVTLLVRRRCTRPRAPTSPSASPRPPRSTPALRAAGTVLLEPIMRLEISTPEDHVGDFVGDLQQRRAIINAARRPAATSR